MDIHESLEVSEQIASALAVPELKGYHCDKAENIALLPGRHRESSGFRSGQVVGRQSPWSQ